MSTEKNADMKKLSMEELGEGIDKEMISVGLIIGDLFKTVTMAAAHLPNMDLHSDIIQVMVDDDSICVKVDGLRKRRRHPDDGIDDHDDYEYGHDEDEEEERIYDEIQ